MSLRAKEIRRVFVFFAVLLSATAERAFADSYALIAVAFTQNENFAGGDDFGNYTINISNNALAQPNAMCGGVANPTACFETHYAGNPNPLFTTTPPVLAVDPNPIAGNQSCTIPSTFAVLNELCTNGHLLFYGSYLLPGGGVIPGIFKGTDPVMDNLSGYLTMDGGFMTANGNAYFISGRNDTLIAAIDLDTIPAPEPNGLALTGTGVLAAIGVARRWRRPEQS